MFGWVKEWWNSSFDRLIFSYHKVCVHFPYVGQGCDLFYLQEQQWKGKAGSICYAAAVHDSNAYLHPVGPLSLWWENPLTCQRATVTSRVLLFTLPRYLFINHLEKKDELLGGLHTKCLTLDSNPGPQIYSQGHCGGCNVGV